MIKKPREEAIKKMAKDKAQVMERLPDKNQKEKSKDEKSGENNLKSNSVNKGP